MAGQWPIASLQGLDSENRVIYTGAFSKALFPSPRIGYLVVPPDQVDAFITGRVMIDLQLATIPQAHWRTSSKKGASRSISGACETSGTQPSMSEKYALVCAA